MWNWLGLHVFEQLLHIFALEGRSQHRHLINYAAKRPHIAFGVIRLVPPDLRTSIIGGAGLRIGEVAGNNFRHIQISQFVTARCFENIGRFQIPMHDASLMQRVQCYKHILSECPYLLLRYEHLLAFDFGDVIMQVSSIWIMLNLPANSMTTHSTLILVSKKAYLQPMMAGDQMEASILTSLSAFSFSLVESWFILTFLSAQKRWSLRRCTLQTVLQLPSPNLQMGVKSLMLVIQVINNSSVVINRKLHFNPPHPNQQRTITRQSTHQTEITYRVAASLSNRVYLLFYFKNKMSVERAASASSKRINLKFTFSDYSFAHFVRQRMFDVLTQYDHDGNQTFDQEEIKNALVQILHQNPNQLYYVLQNVFRYDKDNDRKVTFKEFIDFSVEQHFGEMAIQRLHRQKVYSNGSKRIMNLPEFIKTMEYSLNTINVQGPEEVYQQLFNEVDLDRDGFISYQDYFSFLKQYFGSLHKDEPIVPPSPAPAPFNIDNGAAQRFAKLIYNQLKVILMQIDYNKKMKVEITQAQRFISQVIQANEVEVEQITQIVFRGKDSLDYESFLSLIVPFYFCEYYVNATRLSSQQYIDLNLFVQLIKDASSAIVSVPPSQKTARSIFYLATGGGNGALNIEEYVMLMGNIFQNFSFDRRGLARGQQ